MRDIYDEFGEFLRSSPPVTMQNFIRGQRAKISQLSDRTRRFYLQIVMSSAVVPVFDFVCFGLDAHGQLSDDRFMVFFNQKRAPDKAIVLRDLGEQDAKFEFDLDALPSAIERLVFTASVEGSGTMRDLAASFLILGEAGLLYSQPVAQYRFAGADFSSEGALMLAEIYRKDGQWRFGAQGQGFAGDLSALLKHFGGEEAQNSASPAPSQVVAPLPTPVAAPTVISPPLAAPVVSSPLAVPTVVSSPLAAPAIPLVMGALQSTLDAAPSGATIRLPRGEHQGPIAIVRPLTLEGVGAVIWARSGPVVRVQSAGVTLRDVRIEATDPDPALPDSDVALRVESGAPSVQNVGVSGRVEGIAQAQAQSRAWNLPAFLDLGELAPRAPNSLIFTLETPVACQLKTAVSGLQLAPRHVEAGRHEIQIVAAGIGPDTFLAGQIEVESAGLVRTIPLFGRVAEQKSVPAQQRRIGSVDGAQSAP